MPKLYHIKILYTTDEQIMLSFCRQIAVEAKRRRVSMAARHLFIVLAFGFIHLTGVLAQDALVEFDYDPLVCQSAAELDEDCLAMMQAFPQPKLEKIPEDRFTLNHYSFWRVGPAAVSLYDAPGGQVIGQIPAGFNFINAIDTSVAGWIQRAGGEWLKRENVQSAPASRFTGMLLPPGWRHPFAVILDRTGIYASLRPGEKGSAESDYVTHRYDLVNIFDAEHDEDGNLWYLIGPRQWLRQEYVAKFAPAERPPGVGGHWIAVDLFEQTLIAYEDDRPVFATLISSGLPKWPTNEGVFAIWARLDRDSMSGATGAPDAYALQDVPWTMYFDGDISLHGTYWHNDFGYRRSHGCVNLSMSDARWIYDWTLRAEPDENQEIVNAVYVFSSQQYAD